MTSMFLLCKNSTAFFAVGFSLSVKHKNPIAALFSIRYEIVKALSLRLKVFSLISSATWTAFSVIYFSFPKKYFLPPIIPSIPFPTKFWKSETASICEASDLDKIALDRGCSLFLFNDAEILIIWFSV